MNYIKIKKIIGFMAILLLLCIAVAASLGTLERFGLILVIIGVLLNVGNLAIDSLQACSRRNNRK